MTVGVKPLTYNYSREYKGKNMRGIVYHLSKQGQGLKLGNLIFQDYVIKKLVIFCILDKLCSLNVNKGLVGATDVSTI